MKKICFLFVISILLSMNSVYSAGFNSTSQMIDCENQKLSFILKDNKNGAGYKFIGTMKYKNLLMQGNTVFLTFNTKAATEDAYNMIKSHDDLYDNIKILCE